MNNLIYLLLIITILFSYKFLEISSKVFYPGLVRNQLWESNGYHIWGAILLIIYLIIKPKDFIFKTPINHELGIKFAIYIVIVMAIILITNKNIYYPKRSNRRRCFHFSIVQPIYEEIAFRGLILPMMLFYTENTISIVLLNGIVFMFFHLNYWSFHWKKAPQFLHFLFFGLIYTYLAILTQSVVYTILCHIIGNGSITIYKNLRNNNER